VDVLDCIESTDMNYPSIKSEIDQAERSPSIHELAYSEPDVSSIAPHVFAAHEEQIARATAPQPQPITAEITFKPDIGAFEMVAENRDAMSLLRALGPQAKITIHF
jgi:hypothetical protein